MSCLTDKDKVSEESYLVVRQLSGPEVGWGSTLGEEDGGLGSGMFIESGSKVIMMMIVIIGDDDMSDVTSGGSGQQPRQQHGLVQSRQAARLSRQEVRPAGEERSEDHRRSPTKELRQSVPRWP